MGVGVGMGMGMGVAAGECVQVGCRLSSWWVGVR